MEEIKAGEYVRFLNGKISKVYKVEKVDLYTAVGGFKFGTKKDGFELWIYFSDDDFPLRLEENEELKIKHSPNIIDLIEVGDIVHTRDVLNEDYYHMFDEEMVQATRETIEEGIELVDILTHEQYKTDCYRVKEN